MRPTSAQPVQKTLEAVVLRNREDTVVVIIIMMYCIFTG